MKIAACLIPLHDKSGNVIAYAMVSPEDAHLAEHRWSHSEGYAIRRKNGRLVKLHREILGLPLGDARYGDHTNGDTLDNRRENLRIVTSAESNQNTSSRRASTSRFRGVSFESRTGRWKAQAVIMGRYFWLGRWASETEAARVAAEFRAENMPMAVSR